MRFAQQLQTAPLDLSELQARARPVEDEVVGYAALDAGMACAEIEGSG